MSDSFQYPGRLAIQQRVLPEYRAAFFDALAEACAGGLSVFAGQPQPAEQITTLDQLRASRFIPARNRHFLHPGSPFYQCWQSGIVPWLEEWQPDALIVEANPRYRSTPRAVDWIHARGGLVVGWGLGAPPLGGLLASWRQRARRSFLKPLDAIIAYSQRGAQEYQKLGFSPDRVFVAPNAVALRPTAPPPPRPEQYNGCPSILFVGRLQRRKRIDNLLRACSQLPEMRQPRLWVVGDGPARQELEALAKSIYPLAEFPGARYGPELSGYFALADLFVLPGTGGLAVQQAMSHGLPVIAAEGDGTQDDLVRPANGWIIPPGDLPVLTETLEAALSDAARLRRMGLESYRIVVEEHNLEAMIQVFLKALASDRSENPP